MSALDELQRWQWVRQNLPDLVRDHQAFKFNTPMNHDGDSWDVYLIIDGEPPFSWGHGIPHEYPEFTLTDLIADVSMNTFLPPIIINRREFDKPLFYITIDQDWILQSMVERADGDKSSHDFILLAVPHSLRWMPTGINVYNWKDHWEYDHQCYTSDCEQAYDDFDTDEWMDSDCSDGVPRGRDYPHVKAEWSLGSYENQELPWEEWMVSTAERTA